MDEFEGVPDHYTRDPIQLSFETDQTVFAYFKTTVNDDLLKLPFIEEYPKDPTF